MNNRLLRELGWVEVVRGNRDSPRNGDLELQDVRNLMEMREELLSGMGNAAAFIGRIFHSQDSIWEERCSQIIKEET